MQALKRSYDEASRSDDPGQPASGHRDKRVKNTTLPEATFRGLEGPTTLPPPTTEFVTLRCQLLRFKVWRIVHIPTNYTLMHLHRLLQFMFGWEGSHLHTFEVKKHVRMYASRTGEIKEGVTYIASADRATYRIQEIPCPYGETKKNLDDKEVMLAQIWRDTGDTSRGIVYEYDISSPWTVHITINTQKIKARPHGQMASDAPNIARAKGAPPTEHGIIAPWSPDEYMDEDAEGKQFDKEQFNGSAFERYINGELDVYLDDLELSTCTKEEYAEKYKMTIQRRKQEAREVMGDSSDSDGDRDDGDIAGDIE